MIIHLFGAGDCESVETDRVTKLENSPFLLLGTKPHVREIELASIEWFWIENN